jgi:hypothetical protein
VFLVEKLLAAIDDKNFGLLLAMLLALFFCSPSFWRCPTVV